jgi:putative PEP-CTERM system TPR-repeat lipoprotein
MHFWRRSRVLVPTFGAQQEVVLGVLKRLEQGMAGFTRAGWRIGALALASILLMSACTKDSPEAMLTSGKALLAKHDYRAAAIQFKNLLQANPNFPEARFLLGKTLLEAGDAGSAILELRKALELRYPTDEAAPLLLRAMLVAGQHFAVLEEAGKLTVLSAESRANILDSVSIAYALNGNIEESEKSNRAALEQKADYLPALLTQARLRKSRGAIDEAIKIVDSILARQADNDDAWRVKGDLLATKEDVPGALAAYNKALELRPDRITTHSAVMQLVMRGSPEALVAQQLAAMKKAAPGHPETLYYDAQLAIRKGDINAAREISLQLLKRAPNSPFALLQAGMIENSLHSYVMAESHLTKVLQIAPTLLESRRALAVTYLRVGLPGKAVAALLPIVGKMEKDPEFLALLAEAYVQNGDLKNGELYFAKASKLDPKDARKRTALAMTKLSMGSESEALSDLEQISKSDTGTTADVALISSHTKRGAYDLALKALDGFEKKQPNTAVTHNLRGLIMQRKGDTAGARANFERALSISPGFVAAISNLVDLDVTDGKPEAAIKRLQSAAASNPKSAEPSLMLARLQTSMGAPAGEILEILKRAVLADGGDVLARSALTNHYLKAKNPQMAVTSAQEGLAAIPDSPALLDDLGNAQREAGEFNQALATFGKLTLLRADSPLPFARLAEVHYANKNYAAAADSLRKALSLAPQLLDAQRKLVDILLLQGKAREAIAIAREVQKQRPREPSGYGMEGEIHQSQKALGEAMAAYRTGLKASPGADLAIKVHDLLLQEKKADEADRFATDWTKSQPKDVKFRKYLGERAVTSGDMKAAFTHYLAAVEQVPADIGALNNLAYAASKIKDPRALGYAERAMALAPRSIPVMDTLATVLVEKGDFTRALPLYVKLLQMAPEAAHIRLGYASALIKSGDKSEARRQIDELEKLDAKSEWRIQATELRKAL